MDKNDDVRLGWRDVIALTIAMYRIVIPRVLSIAAGLLFIILLIEFFIK
ncbi:hypothetical protein [Caloranaerobacter sp. DY30410]